MTDEALDEALGALPSLAMEEEQQVQVCRQLRTTLRAQAQAPSPRAKAPAVRWLDWALVAMIAIAQLVWVDAALSRLFGG